MYIYIYIYIYVFKTEKIPQFYVLPRFTAFSVKLLLVSKTLIQFLNKVPATPFYMIREFTYECSKK